MNLYFQFFFDSEEKEAGSEIMRLLVESDCFVSKELRFSSILGCELEEEEVGEEGIELVH